MKRESRSTSRSKIRAAIYTRKSSDEGLDQEFNSLDAQRESGEAYIASQKHEGWVCLPERYDDGGFSGGDMERPALKRLMADIDEGEIDVVVVYKLDRLSRSLLDFAKLLGHFQQHNVDFVAVTQSFDTSSSTGRLIMNVLMSFAEFERQLVSERTRDKIAATRRKGKWAGGHPVLGYDIDPGNLRLLINEDEARRVREIFDLYLEHEALIPVVKILNERGWTTKRWTTRKGNERGGKPFDKTRLHGLLTNVVYVGKVKYKHEIHEGEHDAIVNPKVWQRVQQVLLRNGRTGGSDVRNRYGALLKGILHCAPCGCSMGHTYSSKHAGKRRYRYYVCLSAQKRGWNSCPSKSIPAEEIEQLVVDRIRAIGRDPSLISATLQEARKQAKEETERLNGERTTLERELKRCHNELRKVVAGNGSNTDRIAELNERVRVAEQRLVVINEELVSLDRGLVTEREVSESLGAFDPLWETLSPRERARIVRLLVERVDFDGEKGRVAITFHPTGLRALGEEMPQQEAAA